MRIISSFHDYYDPVMRTGMDTDVLYIRHQKTIEINKQFKTSSRVSSKGSTKAMLLGFCGEIYPVFEVDFKDKITIFYSFEEFKKFTLLRNITNKWDFKHNKWFGGRFRELIEQDFTLAKELFHKYQIPIFLVGGRNYTTHNHNSTKKEILTLNPCLKDLDFQKIKDPYTTYQYIFQYVSGVLNQPENKMVDISDEDKAHKHGYNKWSFKKLPGKKRKRNKN